MDGRNPFWKRSGFGGLVLYVVSFLAFWAFDGEQPGSMEVITSVSMGLALFGYQVGRPSAPLQ